MGKPSKLSEAEWEALFARDAAGEPRRALAAEHGVALGTIAWQARKRQRLKGLSPGAVDRRRRPADGWPDDHVFTQSRSGMTPARWDAALTRYAAGEDRAALGAEYGFHPATLMRRAQAEGRRKCDLADAVYRPRGLWRGRARPEMAAALDIGDMAASERTLAEVIARAMKARRLADATLLMRIWFLMQGVERGIRAAEARREARRG